MSSSSTISSAGRATRHALEIKETQGSTTAVTQQKTMDKQVGWTEERARHEEGGVWAESLRAAGGVAGGGT